MASDRRASVTAVAVIFFVLSWISTILRAIVRAGVLKSYGRDDWTMLITQFLFTGYLACQLGGVVHGTGRHLSDLEPASAEAALEYWFFCELFYILATAMMKVSISFFLLRVTTHKYHAWILRGLIGVSTVCGTAFFFLFLFQCTPVSIWWSLEPHQDQCIPVRVIMGISYGISGLIVTADWSLGILPFFIVMDLPMSCKQRILVALILAFAAIGSTATIVRLPYFHTMAESYAGRDAEFLYDTVDVAIWTTVEVGIGITVGSVATLRPLVRMTLDRLDVAKSTRSRARKHISSPVPLDRISSSRDHQRKGYKSYPSPDAASISQEQLGSFDFGVFNKTPVLNEIDVENEGERSRSVGSPWRIK